MKIDTQISAYISKSTKELLERHVRATGLKKGHVIEAALLHHMQALQALPADMVVKSRLVVSRLSGEEILKKIKSPKPSSALKNLLQRDGD